VKQGLSSQHGNRTSARPIASCGTILPDYSFLGNIIMFLLVIFTASKGCLRRLWCIQRIGMNRTDVYLSETVELDLLQG
jgi:hypothetical protein